MTPQEKALIDSVFDRLAQTASGTKDAEALAHIRERIAQLPDASYGLVQAVLIQEMALNNASTRITQLEHQLSESGAQGSGSSFLGGSAGAAGPWGARASQPQPAPQPQPQPQYQQPPQYQPPPSGPWGQPAGGGFLHNMASMAAGVAGGTLLAEGIASLFGGRHFFGPGYGGGFGGIGGGYGPWGNGMGGGGETIENITVNNYGDANTGAASNGNLGSDPDIRDASFDSSGDDSSSFDDGGGFDGGGSDFSDT